MENTDYNDGFRAGRAHRLMNHRSEYSYAGASIEPPGRTADYCRGYRDGWLDVGWGAYNRAVRL